MLDKSEQEKIYNYLEVHIIAYTHTTELCKNRTPDTYMILFITEDIMNKNIKITLYTFMIIYMTEYIINKKEMKIILKGREKEFYL